MTNKTEIKKDLADKKISITRTFNAPLEKVWQAWTQSDQLDRWWAPRPWKAETKSMDFRAGGARLYCMIGPDGSRHWSLVQYKTVEPLQRFTTTDSFCDEHGNINGDFPVTNWLVEFKETVSGSQVNITITSATEADLEKLIQMGFEAGFIMAVSNLDELLEV